MSFLTALPEALSSAAKDLTNIGSTLNVANTAAKLPTTWILAAAEDEVSAAIAALFPSTAPGFRRSVCRQPSFTNSLCKH